METSEITIIIAPKIVICLTGSSPPIRRPRPIPPIIPINNPFLSILLVL